MASLKQLLSDEGFSKENKFSKNNKKVRFREKNKDYPDQLLPIYICHDRRSFENKTESKTGSSVFSSKRSNSISSLGEPAIDEVAIRAVVSILSGYIGRFLKDENFRNSLREKCYSVLEKGENRGESSENLVNFKLGVESIEKLVEGNEGKKEIRMKLLRNSIRLLTIVASTNSKATKSSHLSACAQLYLSIVYKIEKNDRNSSKHLLQVFCDSPLLAREHLLPDLWEHFFLPHLLHLKIWHAKEIDLLSESGFEFEKMEKKRKGLNKVYNEHMDLGTAKFAIYYKDWLRFGSQSPSVPTIPLPTRHGYKSSRRFSEDSLASHSSINKSLFRTVFGPTRLEWRSLDFDDKNQVSINKWDLEEVEKPRTHEDIQIEDKYAQPLEHRITAHRRSSSQTYRSPKAELWPEAQKSDGFSFFSCQMELTHNGSIRKIERRKHFPEDFMKSTSFLCSSDSLKECELAIRVIIKTWLDLNGDINIEKALSKAPIIEGMLEILFTSNDDEVLELTISILAELVTKNEANAKIITNSDPQLEIFMRLLRSSSLFLKAAILLYLVKPKAKNLISIEWVPLVLRVLQFGDQSQTLLTVRCSPHFAAYYFLEQILNGFDEDRNLENARQVINMGGLGLLVKSFEKGNVDEKAKAVSVLLSCIRADGGCRHYLAANLNKGSIVEFLVWGKQKSIHSLGFEFLSELLCLNRRIEALRFLNELLNGWGNLNPMHILFTFLQKADPKQRPIVAAVLLHLDFLGDPMKCSVYRDEAIDAIIEGLDCDEKVEEQVARALLILGGRFSYKGEATTEKLILEESGVDTKVGDSLADLLQSSVEEDEAMQDWQMNTARALLTYGKKRFLSAMCACISNATPVLSRASLVTIAWISCYLHKIADRDHQSITCSVLVPCLVQSLDHDRAIEDRVLVSFTLLGLTKCAGFWSQVSPVVGKLSRHLRDLSQVTWTARELVSIIQEISMKGSIS